MDIWLYNISLWWIFVGLTLIVTALCSATVLIVRHQGWMLSPESDATNAAPIYGFIGVVYAVALALMVVEVQQGYSNVEQAVMTEANATGDLYRSLHGLEEPARGRFQSQVRNYVDLVIDMEWPAVQQGKHSTATEAFIDRIALDLIDFRPKTAQENLLYPQLLSYMDRVLDARRQRLFLGRQGMGTVTWLVIGVGAAITLGFGCFFPFARLRTHLLLTGSMAAMFAIIMVLLLSMDHPLWGDFSVQPNNFVELRDNLARLPAG